MRTAFLGAALLAALLPTAAAQAPASFFVEPSAGVAWVLGEPTPTVGVRAGRASAAGFGYDFGVDAALRSVETHTPSGHLDASVDRLVRGSAALRYGGALLPRVRYDLGAAVAAGTTDALDCDGGDACVGTGLFLGVGPEVGLTAVLTGRLGLRLAATYAHSVSPGGPDGLSGLALGVGLRTSLR
ncbi:MAG: hypothetical protein ABJF88_11530 [Rhodothermales bacterium]